MFVVIYQPSHSPIEIKKVGNEISLVGKWQVDTDEDGNLSQYDDLTVALDRVNTIRNKGGEACLAVVIE